MSSSARKTSLLGMPYGTATQRLRKQILFRLLRAQKLDFCYRCGEQIESADDLSMEHIVPWQSADDPRATFFDVENIAFSHLTCNVGAHNREKTHCPYGHEYTPANTRIPPNGGRICRECERTASRERWHRNGLAERRRRRRQAIRDTL